MAKDSNPKENRVEAKNKYQKIIDDLKEDLSRLEKELERYVDTPKIAIGIMRNIRDRKEDVQYYEMLLKEFQSKGLASK